VVIHNRHDDNQVTLAILFHFQNQAKLIIKTDGVHYYLPGTFGQSHLHLFSEWVKVRAGFYALKVQRASS